MLDTTRDAVHGFGALSENRQEVQLSVGRLMSSVSLRRILHRPTATGVTRAHGWLRHLDRHPQVIALSSGGSKVQAVV